MIELAVLCRSYGVTVGEVLKATGRPFATGPNDPSLLPVRLALLAAFVAGVTYQVLTIRAARSTKTFLARLTAAYAHAA